MSPLGSGDVRELLSNLRNRMSHVAITVSRRIAAARSRDPIVWLVGCGGLLVIAIIIGTIAMVGEFRERALSNSARELENTVLLLTRHFDQQFEDCDTIATNLIAQMQVSAIPSAERFKAQMSTAEAHEMLRSKTSVSSYIGSVNIFDADGQLVNSSTPGPCRPSTFGPKLFQDLQVRLARDGADRACPERLHRRWTTIVAHRLSDPMECSSA